MIHVFTATGNSLHIAQEISKRNGQKIVFINSGHVQQDDDDTVFIVCPVYFYKIPVNVGEYVSKLGISKSQKVVLVINFGTTPGNAVGCAVREFTGYGIELRHAFALPMPENWILYFNIPRQEVVDSMLSSVPAFADRIMEHLDDEEYMDGGKGRIMTPLANWSYGFFRKTKRFSVDDTCVSCGLCADICPVHAIEIGDDGPHWTVPRCLQCLACVHRCPQKAVQIGRSRHKGRYVNPEAELPDRF